MPCQPQVEILNQRSYHVCFLPLSLIIRYLDGGKNAERRLLIAIYDQSAKGENELNREKEAHFVKILSMTPGAINVSPVHDLHVDRSCVMQAPDQSFRSLVSVLLDFPPVCRFS